METQSIYQLITLLCGSIAKETKCIDLNKISRSRSSAFSVLLKSSTSYNEMDFDVLKELQIHLFEMRINAENVVMKNNCDKMEELLEEKNLYEPEIVSNILQFLLKLKNTNSLTGYKVTFIHLKINYVFFSFLFFSLGFIFWLH